MVVLCLVVGKCGRGKERKGNYVFALEKLFQSLGVEKKIVKSNSLALPGRTGCAVFTYSEILEGKENETLELQKLDFLCFGMEKPIVSFFSFYLFFNSYFDVIETNV